MQEDILINYVPKSDFSLATKQIKEFEIKASNQFDKINKLKQDLKNKVNASQLNQVKINRYFYILNQIKKGFYFLV